MRYNRRSSRVAWWSNQRERAYETRSTETFTSHFGAITRGQRARTGWETGVDPTSATHEQPDTDEPAVSTTSAIPTSPVSASVSAAISSAISESLSISAEPTAISAELSRQSRRWWPRLSATPTKPSAVPVPISLSPAAAIPSRPATGRPRSLALIAAVSRRNRRDYAWSRRRRLNS